MSLQSLPVKPLPTPTSVRVRNKLAGICGSDLNSLMLKFSTKGANVAIKKSLASVRCMGHEVVGEVIETGSAVSSLKLGQRVVLVPGFCCAEIAKIPPCAMCINGLPLLCLHRDDMIPSLSNGAGWSQEFVRQESQLIPLPDNVSDDKGVLIEPLACSLHAIHRRLPPSGQDVIVLGCGVIGLGMIRMLRLFASARSITAVSKYIFQATQAKEAGADHVLIYHPTDNYEQLAHLLNTQVRARGLHNQLLHYGADIVYDAVGSSETLHHALRWVRPRGTVVMAGITPKPSPNDCTTIWLREVDLIGSHGHGMELINGRSVHTFDLVIEALANHCINLKGLVTRQFPLGEYEQAIRIAENKENFNITKVLLDMKVI